MEYHKDTIQWLKNNIRGQGGWVYIYEYSTPPETMMITNLLHDNIIKFDGIHAEPTTGAILRYVLTPIGDIVMGISTATPVASASDDTPQAEGADTGAGYTVEHANQLMRDGKRVHFQNDFNLILHPTDVQKLANILNTETAALRTELTRAQERVAALEGELQTAQAHIGRILPANLKFATSALDYQSTIEDLRKQLSREIAAHHNDVAALEDVINSAYDHSITASKELGYGNQAIAQEYILKTKAVLAEIANPDTED